MSVNAVTTVSIVPDSASARSCSSVSMPVTVPGPPGCGVLMACLFRAAGGRGGGRWGLGGGGEVPFVDRAPRAPVLVLRVLVSPDAADHGDDEPAPGVS